MSKMKNALISCRNAVIHFLYVYVLKPIFFLFDAEAVHNFIIVFGKFLGRHSLLRWKTRVWFDFSDKSLEQKILGINFKNPVGLAAGFDKNAELLSILPEVGFGFVEVGSVTGYPCAGNAKPRLWRLLKSKGLLVYYGLKNDGCEKISEKLKDKKIKIPFGISVAMTNRVENLDTETAIADYAKAFSAFLNVGDYITVNISCPNAEGGQPFSDPQKLDQLLTRLNAIRTNEHRDEGVTGSSQSEGNVGTGRPDAEVAGNPESSSCDYTQSFYDNKKHWDEGVTGSSQSEGNVGTGTTKPIFVKMSPDRSFAEVDAILDILKKHRISGIICSNLTKKRENPLIFDKNLPKVGGVSGKPLQELSGDLISHIYRREKNRFVLVGCGGIFSAEDAYKKIRSGASLLQLITGMIFEGPQLISEINRGLVSLLKRDGFSNISQAIGADFK